VIQKQSTLIAVLNIPPKRKVGTVLNPVNEDDTSFNKWGCLLARTRDVENAYSRKGVTAVEVFNLVEPLRDTLQLQLDSPIVLAKTFGSGSDTNLFANHSATGGNTGLCCVAAGSYVAGDGGLLQKMTTSVHIQTKKLSCDMKPEDAPSKFSMGQIVPLHFCIQGVLTDREQQIQCASY
jgi:hypothetical protein